MFALRIGFVLGFAAQTSELSRWITQGDSMAPLPRRGPLTPSAAVGPRGGLDAMPGTPQTAWPGPP